MSMCSKWRSSKHSTETSLRVHLSQFFCQPTQEIRLQDGMQEPGGSPSWPRCLLIGQNQAPHFSTRKGVMLPGCPSSSSSGPVPPLLARPSLAPTTLSLDLLLPSRWLTAVAFDSAVETI